MQPDTRYPKQVLYTAWHFFVDPSLEPKVVIDFPLRSFTVTRVIEKEHIAKITTRYFDNEEYNELLQMSECSELLRWIDECHNSKEYHKEMDYKYGYRDGWHIHCEMTLCGEPTPIQITLGGGDAPVNPFEKSMRGSTDLSRTLYQIGLFSISRHKCGFFWNKMAFGRV